MVSTETITTFKEAATAVSLLSLRPDEEVKLDELARQVRAILEAAKKRAAGAQ